MHRNIRGSFGPFTMDNKLHFVLAENQASPNEIGTLPTVCLVQATETHRISQDFQLINLHSKQNESETK